MSQLKTKKMELFGESSHTSVSQGVPPKNASEKTQSPGVEDNAEEASPIKNTKNWPYRFEKNELPKEVKTFNEKPKSKEDKRDVILMAENTKLYFHKALLLGYSTYFKDKLSNDKTEKTKAVNLSRVTLEISPSSLALLQDCLYKNLSLTLEQAKELIGVTTKLKIEYWSKKCIEVICETLCIDNCLDILLLASASENKTFIEIVHNGIKKHLKALLKSKMFLNLPLERIASLIQRKNPALSEEVVSQLIDGWLAFDDRRLDYKLYTQVKTLEFFSSEDKKKNSIFDQKPEDFKIQTSDKTMPGWIFLTSLITPNAAANAMKAIPEVKATNRNKFGELIKTKMLDEPPPPPPEFSNSSHSLDPRRRKRPHEDATTSTNANKSFVELNFGNSVSSLPKIPKRPRKSATIETQTDIEMNSSTDSLNDSFGQNRSFGSSNTSSNRNNNSQQHWGGNSSNNNNNNGAAGSSWGNNNNNNYGGNSNNDSSWGRGNNNSSSFGNSGSSARGRGNSENRGGNSSFRGGFRNSATNSFNSNNNAPSNNTNKANDDEDDWDGPAPSNNSSFIKTPQADATARNKNIEANKPDDDGWDSAPSTVHSGPKPPTPVASNNNTSANDEWEEETTTTSSSWGGGNNNNSSSSSWNTGNNATTNSSFSTNNNSNRGRGGSFGGRGRGNGDSGRDNNNSSGGWGSSTAKDEWGDDTGGNESNTTATSWGGGNSNSNNDSSWGGGKSNNDNSWGGGGGNNGSSWGSSNNDSNSRGRGGRGGRGGGDRGRGRGGGGTGPRESRPGDWDCASCGATGNFAKKTECFKCHEPRPAGVGGNVGGGRPPREPRPGDWDCPSCNFTGNFASKQECYKCKEPKPAGLGNNNSNRGGGGFRGGGRGRGRGRGDGGGSSWGGSSNKNDSGGWGSNKNDSGGWGSNKNDSGGWGSNNNNSSNNNSGWGGATSAKADDDDDWDAPAPTPSVTKPVVVAKKDDGDDWDAPPPSKPTETNTNNQNKPVTNVKPVADEDDGWETPGTAVASSNPPVPKNTAPKDDDDDGWETPAAAVPRQSSNFDTGTSSAKAIPSTLSSNASNTSKVSAPPPNQDCDMWNDNVQPGPAKAEMPMRTSVIKSNKSPEEITLDDDGWE